MESSTSALPTVAAERATMCVALELSKSIWLVALHSPVADKVSQRRFAGGDVDGLLVSSVLRFSLIVGFENFLVGIPASHSAGASPG